MLSVSTLTRVGGAGATDAGPMAAARRAAADGEGQGRGGRGAEGCSRTLRSAPATCAVFCRHRTVRTRTGGNRSRSDPQVRLQSARRASRAGATRRPCRRVFGRRMWGAGEGAGLFGSSVRAGEIAGADGQRKRTQNAGARLLDLVGIRLRIGATGRRWGGQHLLAGLRGDGARRGRWRRQPREWARSGGSGVGGVSGSSVCACCGADAEMSTAWVSRGATPTLGSPTPAKQRSEKGSIRNPDVDARWAA
eukprot:362868-Chlamydomonas_euryale.AAC.5